MVKQYENLRTEFAGLVLKNPMILASATPTQYPEMIDEAFACGWGGAVLKTVYYGKFIPGKEPKPLLAAYKHRKRLIGMQNLSVAPPLVMEHWQVSVPHLKAKYPDHVIIGSIATSENNKEEWQALTRGICKAGVDAIEVDIACSHNPDITINGEIIGQSPQAVKRIVAWLVETAQDVPVIIKIPATAPDLDELAHICEKNGAKALTAINTIPGMVSVDLDSFVPQPAVGGKSSYGGYSGPSIKPVALRVVSRLSQAGNLPISGCGGISRWQDAVEFMLLGAGTVQVCTAVMWYGYEIIDHLLAGLSGYVTSKGFTNVSELIGLANRKMA
jgi:dihydropyrimidine dehydrogenase (NAD+) subunit PreA